jgi:hypothetical protein
VITVRFVPTAEVANRILLKLEQRCHLLMPISNGALDDSNKKIKLIEIIPILLIVFA